MHKLFCKVFACIPLALFASQAIGTEYAELVVDMRKAGTYKSGAPDAWRACPNTGVYTEERPESGYLPLQLEFAHHFRKVRDETGRKEKMYREADWDAKHAFRRVATSQNLIHVLPERFPFREGQGEDARYPWKEYGFKWFENLTGNNYREVKLTNEYKGAVTYEQHFKTTESDKNISLISRLSYDRWDRALGDLVAVSMYLKDTKGETFRIAFHEVFSGYTCFQGDVSNLQTAWQESEIRDDPIAGKPRSYSNRPIQRTALYWGYLYKDGQDFNYATDKPQILLLTRHNLISYEPTRSEAAL